MVKISQSSIRKLIKAIKYMEDDDINELINYDAPYFIDNITFATFTELIDTLFATLSKENKPFMMNSIFDACLNSYSAKNKQKVIYMIKESIKHNRTLYSEYFTEYLFETSYDDDRLNPNSLNYAYSVCSCMYDEDYAEHSYDEDYPETDMTFKLVNKYCKLFI